MVAITANVSGYRADMYNESRSRLTVSFGNSLAFGGLSIIVFDAAGCLTMARTNNGRFILHNNPTLRFDGDIHSSNRDAAVRQAYLSANILLDVVYGGRYESVGGSVDDTVELLQRACQLGSEGYLTRQENEGWAEFKPPIRHNGLLMYVPVTEGCKKKPACSFCDLFSKETFHVIDRDTFENRIAELAAYNAKVMPVSITHVEGKVKPYDSGKSVHRVEKTAPVIYLASSNIFALDPQELIERLNICQEYFNPRWRKMPAFPRISGFVHAGFVEPHIPFLDDYHRLGLDQVWVGLESGHNKSLELIRKGVSVEQIIESVNRIKTADITCEVTFLKTPIHAPFSEQHVVKTVEALNKMKPECTYPSPLIVKQGTVLEKQIKRGEVTLPSISERAHFAELMYKRLRSSGLMVWSYDVVPKEGNIL
jgi:hypothetical protein